MQFPIAQAHAQIEAADLMRYKAAWLFEQGQPCGAEANMAKLLAAEASWEAANACLDTHGGFGFAEEYDVERKFRETRLYTGRAGLEQPDPGLPRPARARHAALVLGGFGGSGLVAGVRWASRGKDAGSPDSGGAVNPSSQHRFGCRAGGVVVARRRREYSAQERRELWERWKRGESVSEIGRALDRAPGTVHRTIREHGGVPPRERRRSRLALTLRGARGDLSRCRGWRVGAADRGPSRPGAVDDHARARPPWWPRRLSRGRGRPAGVGARRGGRSAASSPAIRRWPGSSRRSFEQDWSPQQIAGWLKLEFPDDETMRVSHETIYLTLFIQARGALKRELLAHLRRSRSIRRPRAASRGNRGQGQIVDAVSIRERPAEAADRAIPGHWEGDLLAGAANSHIATLVERHSRFLHARRRRRQGHPLGHQRAQPRRCAGCPSSCAARSPGTAALEMAEHARFTVATDVKVYFCDPQSPWQRGSNENTNGLLRQYLPKGTNLSKLTQPQLDAIAAKLNTRPRRTLDFKTPADTLNAALR